MKSIGLTRNSNAVVHYPIINPMLLYFATFFIGGFSIIIETMSIFGVYSLLLFVLFTLITLPTYYLFWASKSYGFAILENEIYAINPNYPFHSLIKLYKKDISSIKIGRYRTYGLSYLFLSFYNSYLEIETGNETHRFYCYSLEDEHYDNFEGWETKTSDGLKYQLKSKNYPIT